MGKLFFGQFDIVVKADEFEKKGITGTIPYLVLASSRVGQRKIQNLFVIRLGRVLEKDEFDQDKSSPNNELNMLTRNYYNYATMYRPEDYLLHLDSEYKFNIISNAGRIIQFVSNGTTFLYMGRLSYDCFERFINTYGMIAERNHQAVTFMMLMGYDRFNYDTTYPYLEEHDSFIDIGVNYWKDTVISFSEITNNSCEFDVIDMYLRQCGIMHLNNGLHLSKGYKNIILEYIKLIANTKFGTFFNTKYKQLLITKDEHYDTDWNGGKYIENSNYNQPCQYSIANKCFRTIGSFMYNGKCSNYPADKLSELKPFDVLIYKYQLDMYDYDPESIIDNSPILVVVSCKRTLYEYIIEAIPLTSLRNTVRDIYNYNFDKDRVSYLANLRLVGSGKLIKSIHHNVRITSKTENVRCIGSIAEESREDFIKTFYILASRSTKRQFATFKTSYRLNHNSCKNKNNHAAMKPKKAAMILCEANRNKVNNRELVEFVDGPTIPGYSCVNTQMLINTGDFQVVYPSTLDGICQLPSREKREILKDQSWCDYAYGYSRSEPNDEMYGILSDPGSAREFLDLYRNNKYNIIRYTFNLNRRASEQLAGMLIQKYKYKRAVG